MLVSMFFVRRAFLVVMALSVIGIVFTPKSAEAISCNKLNDKANYHQREGQRLFRERNFAGAEREFGNLLYYMHKGERKVSGLWRRCRFNDREKYYRRYSMAYTWRGVSRFFQGKQKSAIEDYQTAIKKDYKNGMARYMLGIAYVRGGNRNAAMVQYRILSREKSKYAPKLYRAINR